MLEQLLLPMLLVAGVGVVSIGGCGVVVVSVQILPACNHGQIWAEVRVQAGRWWWWSWVVVGNWGWMVGGSRWFVVDSVWVISFIEVLIRRAQKSLEIRAKYVARKSTYGYTLCFVVVFQLKLASWYRFFRIAR